MMAMQGNLCAEFWGIPKLVIRAAKSGEDSVKGIFLSSGETICHNIQGRILLTGLSIPWFADYEQIPVFIKTLYALPEKGEVLAYFVVGDTRYPLVVLQGSRIYLATSPDETIAYLLDQHYARQARPLYTYLPFHYHRIPYRIFLNKLALAVTPQKKSHFPSWPIEITVEFLRWLMRACYERLYSAVIKKKIWEKGKYCVVFSHDVDTLDGFRNIPLFLPIEKERGIVSTWNIVGHYYPIDTALLTHLLASGHEIGLHDFNHDNKTPFLPLSEIRARFDACLTFIKKYSVTGYRSSSLLTSEKLFDVLPNFFAYDSSVADTENSIPGSTARGCCSVFPYRKGRMLEIPLTVPMDSTLIFYRYTPQEIYNLWVKKISFIRRVSGLAVITTHTESHFSGNQEMLRIYGKIIDYIRSDKDACIITANKVWSHYLNFK